MNWMSRWSTFWLSRNSEPVNFYISEHIKHGWMYLVAVIDWYSRYIVSWELDQTLEIDFVLKATQTALAHAKPEIWNSDQGSHFTSP